MPKKVYSKGVDPACVELAEHFLEDCKGGNPRELAELIQDVVEGYCSNLWGDGDDDSAA
jgi:hypothetical protein